jgi:hypothetical protein
VALSRRPCWTSVNLDFYGIGGDLAPGIGKIGYNLKGAASFQEATRRIGDTDNFVGARWLYLDFQLELQRSGARFESEAKRVCANELGPRLDVRPRFARQHLHDPKRPPKRRSTWRSTVPTSAATIRSRRTAVTCSATGLRTTSSSSRCAPMREPRAAMYRFYQFPFIDLRGAPAVALPEREYRRTRS